MEGQTTQMQTEPTIVEKMLSERIDLTLGKRADTWIQYGLSEAPILLKGDDGKLFDSKYKAILKEETLKAIVSKKYVLYPNEEVVKVAGIVAEKLNMNLYKTYTSKTGNAVFSTYLKKTDAVLPDGDTLKLGFSIRNSIDGSVGLGIDLFTFRNICSNGVIFGKKDLNNTKRKHIGNMQLFIDIVGQTIESVMENCNLILGQYADMQLYDITQEQANKLAEKLPTKYFPDAMEVLEDKTIRLNQKATIWRAYNDITDKVWHTEKLDIRTKKKYLTDTHTILAPVEIKARL